MELHVLVVLEAYFPNTTMLTVDEYDFMWERLLTNLNHGALRHEHYSLHLAWLKQWLSRTVIPTEVGAAWPEFGRSDILTVGRISG